MSFIIDLLWISLIINLYKLIIARSLSLSLSHSKSLYYFRDTWIIWKDQHISIFQQMTKIDCLEIYYKSTNLVGTNLVGTAAYVA